MRSRHVLWAAVLAALVAFFAPGTARAVVQIEADSGVVRTSTAGTGRVAPTAAQRAAVARLGARAPGTGSGRRPRSRGTGGSSQRASRVRAQSPPRGAGSRPTGPSSASGRPPTSRWSPTTPARQQGSRRQLPPGLRRAPDGRRRPRDRRAHGLGGRRVEGRVRLVVADERAGLWPAARSGSRPAQAWVKRRGSRARTPRSADVHAAKRVAGWQTLRVEGRTPFSE